MTVKENIESIKNKIPQSVSLVAVSKTKPIADLLEAYDAGQRIFGENKIQEMVDKYQDMPKDIKWHMIGHLQRNKVKYMASFVDLIHSVDSLKLLKEIQKQALKHDRVIDCLLQIKIAKEDSKFGLSLDEAEALLESKNSSELENVNIKGLMGMATFTNDQAQVRAEFQFLKSVYDRLKMKHPELEILSMGMSGDYPVAIDCGSNMIRVGSSIFGSRNSN